jgi:hypothetical protein
LAVLPADASHGLGGAGPGAARRVRVTPGDLDLLAEDAAGGVDSATAVSVPIAICHPIASAPPDSGTARRCGSVRQPQWQERPADRG